MNFRLLRYFDYIDWICDDSFWLFKQGYNCLGHISEMVESFFYSSFAKGMFVGNCGSSQLSCWGIVAATIQSSNRLEMTLSSLNQGMCLFMWNGIPEYLSIELMQLLSEQGYKRDRMFTWCENYPIKRYKEVRWQWRKRNECGNQYYWQTRLM